KKKQRSYKIREKWDTVRRMQEVGVQEVARELLCARCTAHGWWQQADKLMSFIGHVTSKTMKGRDVRNCCPTSLPSMKDKRRNKLMPEATMKSTGYLEETRAGLVCEFFRTYGANGSSEILNVDENANSFGMPGTSRIWAGRGRRDAARQANTSRKEGRMTAVLTSRAE
ncbi:hypothetical protein GN958_ATG05385, partial [Phytophthora infestans]